MPRRLIESWRKPPPAPRMSRQEADRRVLRAVRETLDMDLTRGVGAVQLEEDDDHEGTRRQRQLEAAARRELQRLDKRLARLEVTIARQLRGKPC